MSEESILEDWFNNKSNTDRLFTIAYSEPNYNFILANAPMRFVEKSQETFYNVFGSWQKVVIKKAVINSK